jgi:AcrR family transcriptional regulator
MKRKRTTAVAPRRARPGRPRSFDPDKALDQALKVFWRNGYEGTSLDDLTRATGVNRPSLYAVFGNKEELFRKALDRYAEGPAGYVCRAMQEPTARGVVEQLFRGVIDAQSDRRNPRGCLFVQGALSCGDDADAVRRELITRRKAGEDALRKRFERAVAEGDLPADADPAALALYVVAVTRGMAVQAASGATRDQLERIAQTALRAWPA